MWPARRLGRGIPGIHCSAHLHGIEVVGRTLLPWEGVCTFNEPAEVLRQQVNQWIRTCGLLDKVIDFDAVMLDPAQARRLAPRFDSGIRPNDAGNAAMAGAIDLELCAHQGFVSAPAGRSTHPAISD